MKRSRTVDILLIVVVAAPFVAALGSLVGTTYHPNADIALIELGVRDVGRHETLLGVYSRFGWKHPGPALFLFLTAPYRLLGSRSVGLSAAAVLANGISAVGILLTARKEAGRAFAGLTVVLVLVLVNALGPDFLRDPWNPHIAVLPLAFLLLLAWRMGGGRPWLLPAVVGTGSAIVQVHLGFGLVVAATSVAAVVALVARLPDRGALWRPLLVALAVAAVAWCLPLYEELRGGDGNLTALLRFYRSGQATQGALTGYRVVGTELSLWPSWITGAPAPTPFTGEASVSRWPVPLLLVPLIAALVVAVRARDRRAVDLLLLGALATAAAVVSVAGIVGPAYSYIVRWVWVPPWLLALAGALVLSRGIVRLTGRYRRAAGGAVLTAAMALGVLTSVGAAGAGLPNEPQSDVVGELAAEVAGRLPRGAEPVLLETGSSFFAVAYGQGLFLQLERRGVEIVVDRSRGFNFGTSRVADDPDRLRRLVVVADDEVTPLRDRPGYVELSSATSVPPAQRRAALRGLDELRARGYTGRELFERAAELPDPGYEIAVFLAEPGP